MLYVAAFHAPAFSNRTKAFSSRRRRLDLGLPIQSPRFYPRLRGTRFGHQWFNQRPSGSRQIGFVALRVVKFVNSFRDRERELPTVLPILPATGFSHRLLGQHIMKDVTVYIRQSEVAAAISISKVFVLNSELVQDGRPDVIKRARVFDGAVA